ncbi:FAD-dependent oxidoreductase [bacterium]|nr:FAD-dependent oxidoreductase [bacterium]
MDRADVVVIGAGIAGLATAAWAARSGRSVIVLEKAAAAGGRARTANAGPFRFNLGPHALYCGGPAERALDELGVPFTGRKPNASGGYAVARGAAHALPGGFLSLLTTGLFGAAAKLETATLLGGLARLDPEPLQGTSVDDWLARDVRHPGVRALVGALVRVSSYAADHQRMSAGAALAQIQHALGAGVRYLDGGWQGLVDGLAARARAAGATLCTSRRATAVASAAGRRAVRLAGGGVIDADAVVIAAGPDGAAELLDGAAGDAARAWAAAARPLRAACLDLGLARLPRPRATFALGIDQPLYLSVHSAAARLAPDGAAVIHVMKYLVGDADPTADQRQLEGLMDLIQPGWREVVVEHRFLPTLLVANALPTAAMGGLRGRPDVAVPGVDGVFVAGDWVGAEGLLADASLASARRAAAAVATRRLPSMAAA